MNADDWVEDGFGGCWAMCDREDCGLDVVRPGGVQCWCDSEDGPYTDPAMEEKRRRQDEASQALHNAEREVLAAAKFWIQHRSPGAVMGLVRAILNLEAAEQRLKEVQGGGNQ